MAQEHIEVSPQDAGERLDRFLRRQPAASGQSRLALAELIAQGRVRVNGRRASNGLLLRAGDRVQLDPSVQAQGPAADAALGLRLLHEDAFLVAIDKPAGMPSHALRPGETGNAASALLARYPEMAGVGHRPLEPGILHRLDTQTSGVLLAARSAEAFDALHALHARGALDKQYLALCVGLLRTPQRVDAYLDARQRRVRVEREPFGDARAVSLEILAAQPQGALSLVTVRVAFAARHQVRAQLAALGHPIVGDSVYGGPALPGLTRHALHASRVSFTHPLTGQQLDIQAPLPPELTSLLTDS